MTELEAVKNIDQIIQYAEEHCRRHGSRLTSKRKRILAALISSKKALSAYELVDICKATYGEAIPPMSIYRILEFLEGEKLVHKLNLANKYVACTHISCDHKVPQFLICGNCSEVKEVSINPDTIEDLQASVQLAGFRLNTPQIEMNCLCNNCSVPAV